MYYPLIRRLWTGYLTRLSGPVSTLGACATLILTSPLFPCHAQEAPSFTSQESLPLTESNPPADAPPSDIPFPTAPEALTPPSESALPPAPPLPKSDITLEDEAAEQNMQALDLPPCPRDTLQLHRVCYDKIFDSPVAKKECYGHKDKKECMAIYAQCVRRCNGAAEAVGPQNNRPRQALLMRALAKQITQATRRLTCGEDADCGVYVLKTPQGCSAYAPFSGKDANVKALQQWVSAYNSAADHLSNRAECPNDLPAPEVRCEKHTHGVYGACKLFLEVENISPEAN